MSVGGNTFTSRERLRGKTRGILVGGYCSSCFPCSAMHRCVRIQACLCKQVCQSSKTLYVRLILKNTGAHVTTTHTSSTTHPNIVLKVKTRERKDECVRSKRTFILTFDLGNNKAGISTKGFIVKPLEWEAKLNEFEWRDLPDYLCESRLDEKTAANTSNTSTTARLKALNWWSSPPLPFPQPSVHV